MELSVVRIHKAIHSGRQPWAQARSVIHPDKYLSQCPFILLNEESHASFSEFPVRSRDGVIAMTLVLEGSVEQTDGRGERWRLDQGDADFSTGRGGVLRAETSGEQGVRFLHLWVNMPASRKPGAERRCIVRREHARRVRFDDASGLLYAGSIGSTPTPQGSPWPITIMDVSLQAGGKASFPLASSERSFSYILSGSLQLGRNEVRLNRGNVAWTERSVVPGDVDALTARAVSDTRLVFISSPVIGERPAGIDDQAPECTAPLAVSLTTIGSRQSTLEAM